MNYSSPVALEKLVQELSKLPGIGRKTARRLAFHLISGDREKMESLANSLIEAKERLVDCRRCYGVAENEICPICANSHRDNESLCVVERASDILPFENSGVYKGFYFVLGGVLSPLDGIKPEDLHIPELMERIERENIKELILALGSSPEAESTALYIDRHLASSPVRRTRLARGIPVGSDLEFIDDVTMLRAFEERVRV
ncbi:MAG: recombination mediator RecR [Fibromonadaceae bacterium]|jgi:recombination protein RecR|nr:recombination mediator RecR [Fibromonadaceae bacterium]